jgi:hypothetical protein
MNRLPRTLVAVEPDLQHALDNALLGLREIASFDPCMETSVVCLAMG